MRFSSSGKERNGRRISDDKISSKLKKKSSKALRYIFQSATNGNGIAGEWAWDLMRGEFVMALQRMRAQYLDYLQGLLLVALHPPWCYRVDEILEKHFVEFSSANIFMWLGEKGKKEKATW